MKKFLVIFILGLLWSNVVLAAKITLSCQTTSMTVYTEDVKTGKRERTTFDWHLDPQPFLIDITKNNWIFENDIFAKMYIDYEAMNFIEDGVGKKYFTAIYTEIHRYTGSYYRTRIRFPEEDFKRMNDLYKKMIRREKDKLLKRFQKNMRNQMTHYSVKGTILMKPIRIK